MKEKRKTSLLILIITTVLLVFFLLLGQTYALFDFETATSLGLQETEEEIGSVGIAFAKGFAFGDTIIYVPLLLLGMIGLWKGKIWGDFTMFGGLAISIYWTSVHLYTIFIERDAIVLHSEKYTVYPILLGLIILHALWGMKLILSRISIPINDQ